MKIGLVMEGGAMRGLFTAGVIDVLMENQITFDGAIGVSAGAAFGCNFKSRQIGRVIRYNTKYCRDPRYGSFRSLLKTGDIYSKEFAYGELPNVLDPFDTKAFSENPMEFYVVATEAETGQARYFDKAHIRQDDYNIMKASSALPFACKPYPIGGTVYYDGALGDPVPIEKAFQLGCDRVVLLLTKPVNVLRSPKKDEKVAACIRRAYPAAAQKLCQRAQRYNESVALARMRARQGKVLIVAPEDTCGVDTLTKDKQALRRLYEMGYADGKKITDYLSKGR